MRDAAVVSMNALGELLLIREADIDDQVIDRPLLGGVDDRLVHGRGDAHLPRLRVVEKPGLDAGLLERPGIGAPGDEFGRDELAVDLVGVNEEARGRIPQDREAVLVVEPVVELVAAGQTAQDGAVRLFDVDRDVPEIGRLEEDPDGKDKSQTEAEPFCKAIEHVVPPSRCEAKASSRPVLTID